jgi:hypothetical protein
VTKRRRFKIRFGLGLAVAAIALGAPATAQAENVVPNTPAPQRGVGKGVVIEVRQRHASVRFTPAADELYARYRGRRIWLQCAVVAERRDGSLDSPGYTITTRIRVRRHVRVAIDRPLGGFSFCRLSRSEEFYSLSKELVFVPLARVGRLYLEERDTFRLILGFSPFVRDGDGSRFASDAEFAAFYGAAYRIEELPNSESSPSPGAVGYWSDIQEHALVAKLTSRGTRFFVEWTREGRPWILCCLRTNAAAYLAWGP